SEPPAGAVGGARRTGVWTPCTGMLGRGRARGYSPVVPPGLAAGHPLGWTAGIRARRDGTEEGTPGTATSAVVLGGGRPKHHPRATSFARSGVGRRSGPPWTPEHAAARSRATRTSVRKRTNRLG